MSDKGQISDGYHTFDELYEHRHSLFGALAKCHGGWKSLQHHDPGFPMYPGWFIAGVQVPSGSITYHLPMKYWVEFPAKTLERAPEWDGHSPADVVTRLFDFWSTLTESAKEENERLREYFHQLLPKEACIETEPIGVYKDDDIAEQWSMFRAGYFLNKERI